MAKTQVFPSILICDMQAQGALKKTQPAKKVKPTLPVIVIFSYSGTDLMKLKLNRSDVNNQCLFLSSCHSVSQCKQPKPVAAQILPVEHTEPRYSLPSRCYFSDVTLTVMHNVVSTHNQKLLDSSVNYISLHNRYMAL